MTDIAGLVAGPPAPLDGPTKTAWPRWVNQRLRTALLVGPLVFFIFCQPFRAPTDPDYWWHLRTGQLIYETGAVPRVDPFLYTTPGRPWVAHEWGTELLLYVVSRSFGFVGNVVLFGLVNALTALVVYATCRRRGAGEVAAALLMLLAFSASLANAAVRPQVLDALFLGVTALVLTRDQPGGSRSLWALPPLFLLWVNLHGGYIIGFALLGLTLVGRLLARRSGPTPAPLRPLLAVTLACAVVTLANPFGVEAWIYPFTFLGAANPSLALISEWQTPSFHVPLFYPFGLSLLLGLLLGMWRRPLGPSEVLWALFFSALGLESVRLIPLYAVVVIPLIAARLQAELPLARRSLAEWQRPALLLVAAVAVVVLAIAPLLSPLARASRQLGREPDATGMPVGAVAYLRAYDPPGNLFNDYAFGGYLIDTLYPRRKVFIDGRPDMYGADLLSDYLTVMAARPGWQTVLDRYQVTLALVPASSPLALTLSQDPAWRLLYQEPAAQLFGRAGSPSRG